MHTFQLIVSSEDYIIRVYKGDDIIAEVTETEVVTGLTVLPENKFAYSVSNGTIGVYEQDVRLWRVKVSEGNEFKSVSAFTSCG